MKYTHIIAVVSAVDAEPVSDLLRDLFGSGLWLEAPFVQPDLESDAIVDHAADVRVHVYVPDGVTTPERTVADALATADVAATVTADVVAEEDWAESWKEHFHVQRFGKRIVVVPSWREYEPVAGDVVLLLDPGMAFGTGQHETTRMCLEALELSVRAGDRVLDAGCGSGILSIAAAKLGASSVRAVDIDPDCVRVTEENARANGVDDIIDARTSSAAEGSRTKSYSGEVDLVVVNIIARVIVELAPQLALVLAPGGRIIASGIIAEREAEVADALVEQGLRIVSSRAMGEWRCIEAVSDGVRS